MPSGKSSGVHFFLRQNNANKRFPIRLAAMSEDYRSYAAQCLALAQVSDDAAVRAHLLNLAERWRSMAEKTEKRDQEIPVRDQGAA